jgi:hypothetical protein
VTFFENVKNQILNIQMSQMILSVQHDFPSTFRKVHDASDELQNDYAWYSALPFHQLQQKIQHSYLRRQLFTDMYDQINFFDGFNDSDDFFLCI